MPRISLALSEVIKRRLFRCREHIQCCNTQALEGSVHNLSLATYEIARGLNLPGVRREAGEKTSLYVEDAVINLTTVLDCDLTSIDIEQDLEQLVRAAQELMTAVHTIPLPAEPQARTV